MNSLSTPAPRKAWRPGVCFGLASAGLVAAAALWLSVVTPPPARPDSPTWRKVAPRLAEATSEATTKADAQVAVVEQFFRERKGRARAFAEEVLSLEGKFHFVWSK